MLKGLFDSDQLELIFTLLGACIGVFYAFDGWRGSLKETEFKNSPRLKNFRWAALVLFTTMIADLRFLDPGVQKTRILLFYLVSLVAAATAIIILWGAGIYLKFAWIRLFDSRNYPQPPFTPIADYLQYGYEYHRSRYDAALERSANGSNRRYGEFLSAYSVEIASSLASTNAYLNAPDRMNRGDVERVLLHHICVTVREFHRRSHTDGVEINANYMLAYEAADLPTQLIPRLRFAYGDPKRYSHYLADLPPKK